DDLRTRQVAAAAHDLIVDREHAPGMPEHLLAALRQLDAGKAFLDQIGADERFQPPHMGADRGLCQIEKMGRLGEAAELADGDKRAQQVGRNVGHSGAGVSRGGAGSRSVAARSSSDRYFPLLRVTRRRNGAWYQPTVFALIMPVSAGSCNFRDMLNEFKLWRQQGTSEVLPQFRH